MSRTRINYRLGEIGKTGPAMKDFLLSPDKLVLCESNVKVTHSLSQREPRTSSSASEKTEYPLSTYDPRIGGWVWEKEKE